MSKLVMGVGFNDSDYPVTTRVKLLINIVLQKLLISVK